MAPSRTGRCGARLRHEAGQTIVLVAILLPLFLGLGAIAVDVGYWYVVKKTAQDAADAAALAAARELPGGCDEAELVGVDYGTQNMPSATVVDVTTPCEDPDVSPDRVGVAVTAQADTFFGRFFGLADVTITQHAIAERLDRPGNLAIFVHEAPGDDEGDACSDGHGLEFEGTNTSINGLVHSNSRFRISAGPFWAADGTISKNNCAASIEQGVESAFGSGDPPDTEPRDVPETLEWPVWFSPGDLGWFTYCTVGGETIEITAEAVIVDDVTTPHGGTIPGGTYCATESFALTGDGLRGAMTALAPSITVSADDTQLRPYSGTKVLLFATPDGDLSPANDDTCPSEPSDMWLDGEGNRWSGMVFSPCGRVVVNLSGPQTLEGTIVAHRVRIDADGFDMVGKSDFEVQTALVE